MAITYIDTEQCPRTEVPGAQGVVAEIVNRDLCGAKNVIGMLRWLEAGERFDAEPLPDKHQLIYLMDGNGVISLSTQEYEVPRGAGIYLGPHESATLKQAGDLPLKLLHLIVPQSFD
jgi:quercetin dioxygenase-like cupin family protein